LDGFDAAPDSQVIAQKILSCVARVQESFGSKHVIDVLRGVSNAKVLDRGHDKLSTFGLLQHERENQIREWIHQLIDHEVLCIEQRDMYSILRLNPASWAVMKGAQTVSLARAGKRERVRRSRAETASWEGVDDGLFEALRALRKRLAEEQGVPPFVVFSDATLRELARRRPSSREHMRSVYGIGEAKLASFGDLFLDCIKSHCREQDLEMDQSVAPRTDESAETGPSMNARRSFPRFRAGVGIDAVMKEMGLARSTVCGYLCDYIRTEKPGSVTPWVDDQRFEQIADAVRQYGSERLKPIFVALGEQVSYDDIRIVVATLEARD
jgi:ATP-dependent DNA helicase RecQ